jgi:RNA polymerase sigma-70 factor (ECF subfamily)
MDSTSVSLLERLRRPKPQLAWQRFVDLYAPLMFYWARSKNLSHADAADLVQDVLASLVVALPRFQYDPKQRFRGWLRTIVLNRARDFLRRKATRREEFHPLMLDELAAKDGDLFEEQEYRLAVVQRAFQLLRSEFQETTWQACWRQVIDGEDAAQAAAALGISPNAAYIAKCRVLRRLRTEVQGLLE